MNVSHPHHYTHFELKSTHSARVSTVFPLRAERILNTEAHTRLSKGVKSFNFMNEGRNMYDTNEDRNGQDKRNGYFVS